MRVCAICGRSTGRIENAHITAKGMGGRGPKAPDDCHDTVPLCAGTGGNTDPMSCHGANEAGLMDLRRTPSGTVTYTLRSSFKAQGSERIASQWARRVSQAIGKNVLPGVEHDALYGS